MLEAVVKYVITELSVIAQVPVSFLLCLSVIALIVWRALNWKFLGTIDNLKSRNDLQAAQIADYKDKLSGASPEEAKKRLDSLEIQVKALSPRRLTEEEKQKLFNMLKGFKGKIDIIHDAAAGDAKAYTADIASVFNDAGWELSLPMVMGVGMPPRSGIALQVHDIKALEPIELAVKHALDAVGIQYDIQPALRRLPQGSFGYPNQPNPDVGLLLTTKIA